MSFLSLISKYKSNSNDNIKPLSLFEQVKSLSSLKNSTKSYFNTSKEKPAIAILIIATSDNDETLQVDIWNSWISLCHNLNLFDFHIFYSKNYSNISSLKTTRISQVSNTTKPTEETILHQMLKSLKFAKDFKMDFDYYVFTTGQFVLHCILHYFANNTYIDTSIPIVSPNELYSILKLEDTSSPLSHVSITSSLKVSTIHLIIVNYCHIILYSPAILILLFVRTFLSGNKHMILGLLT